jgi:vancomycin resistance protein YoaR
VVGGVPRVIPSRPGVSYDPDDVHQQFLDLVARPDGQRELTVKSAVARPAFTTRDARRLGIKEQVSTFTTYFPYADYRNVNLPRAAGLIDGTVLKPGETFSLNGTVGERTEANGFTTGWTIRDGQYFEDLGGGVSQIATTTFNAAFFAGMTDVEHKPHSFYIDRYPEGREATVAWGSTDLRFRNDTPYGVYIQESVQKSTPSSYGVVTVSMYSTKYWDITTTKGPRYKVTNYQTLQQSGPKCYAHTGYPGFDVDVNRYWRRAGDPTLVRTEVMHTHYNPEDAVVCS